jgi:hypothetical protein
MKNIGMYLYLLLSSQSFAQVNLVPNPSFEDTVSCPFSIGDIDKAVGWSSFGITPDYFHSCNSLNFHVPNNVRGFQFAHTGNAYVGIGTYRKTTNEREYIGIQLSQNLVIGQRYFVKFYLSRAENFYYATNKMGIKLSTVSYSETNPIPTDNNPIFY